MIGVTLTARAAETPPAEADYLWTVNGWGGSHAAMEWVAGAEPAGPTDSTPARAKAAITMRRRIERDMGYVPPHTFGCNDDNVTVA